MKKMMLKKALRSYIICPLILSIILVGAVIYVLFRDSELALILGIVVAVYILALVVYFFARRKRIMGELVRFATDYGQKQRALLGEMAIPYAVLDTSGRIMFANRKFTTLVETEECMHRTITSLFPDITKDILPTDENVSEVNFKVGGRGFMAQMNYIRMQSLSEDSFWNRSGGAEPDESDALIALYLYDETEVLELKQANIDQKTIIGLLYIDNYEEALESIDEVRRSLLTALVDRKINKYFQGVDAIIRKLEKDKYFFIFKNMYLESLKEAKFSILDEVRSVNIGNDMSVTISMGISTFHDSFTGGYESARAAIDLALGRGGDQVVIKDKEGVIYYGGKSASVEKSTRVKARV
ncbi:MAG: DHH family phosphoesterase, partial [Lachnospiraceae bacterium]|nr:DHH family phosphoesterase [Lachnospiraceae bacterium]